MRTVLVFPHRGPPPEVPPGYEPEPGDPYILHMIWVACKWRGTLDCGACPSNLEKKGPPYCLLLDKLVDQNTCNACTEDKNG